jgi:hypothetical protein
MSEKSFSIITTSQVETILGFARERAVKTVHYVGNADRSLIESLVGVVGKAGVTLMDMHNRWGGGTRYFWDEFESSDMEYPEVEDWLEEIFCFQEGGPDCPDLWIHDIAWSPRRQLAMILAFANRQHRLIPNLALLGPAKLTSRLNSYRWSEVNDVLLATVVQNKVITSIRRI